MDQAQRPAGDPAVVASSDAHRLRALTDFAKALSRIRWSDDVLSAVAGEALRALDADSVSLSQWEREAGWLRTLVNVGELAPGEEPRPVSEIYPVTAFPEQWTLLERGVPFVVNLPPGRGPRTRVEELLRDNGRGSACAAPIVVEGQVWGELFATRVPGHGAFEDRDLDFVTAVAVQVAAGVAQAEHMARVERMAYADPLTGLANRRVLEDALDRAMEQHRADDIPVSLLVADVNDLKAINDDHGHEAGDVALRAFAHVLSGVAADLAGSLVARLGGDEFGVLAVGPRADEVARVAERLCQQARRTLPAGISCGMAATDDLPEAVASGSALFRVADAAQYRAKRARARAPVVAGRHAGADLSPPGPAIGLGPDDGRHLDQQQLLAAVQRVVAAVAGADPGTRVAAVTAEVARVADASSWWVSQLPARTDRFLTRDSAIARLPARYQEDFRQFYDDAEGYPTADYPASLLAAEGAVVVVESDDPEADPAEAALLGLGGFRALVMAGGRDAAGDAWLAEIFADELSGSVREFALALRGAVALALAAPEPTGSPAAARPPSPARAVDPVDAVRSG